MSYLIFALLCIFILWYLTNSDKETKQIIQREKILKKLVPTQNPDKWFSFVDIILSYNDLSVEVDTILMFNTVPIKSLQLLEYCGDFSKIRKLYHNQELWNQICKKCSDWFFNHLKPEHNVPYNTARWLIWNKNGDIVGIIAIWDWVSFAPTGFDFLPLVEII